jgi:hypothetical protein
MTFPHPTGAAELRLTRACQNAVTRLNAQLTPAQVEARTLYGICYEVMTPQPRQASAPPPARTPAAGDCQCERKFHLVHAETGMECGVCKGRL